MEHCKEAVTFAPEHVENQLVKRTFLTKNEMIPHEGKQNYGHPRTEATGSLQPLTVETTDLLCIIKTGARNLKKQQFDMGVFLTQRLLAGLHIARFGLEVLNQCRFTVPLPTVSKALQMLPREECSHN